MYRNSVSSVPVSPGDSLVGTIVGQRRPRSTSSQFSVVDFGLKSEAPFARGEVARRPGIGDSFSRTLLDLEDDFNEPLSITIKDQAFPLLLQSAIER